jgi:hypothetical protein
MSFRDSRLVLSGKSYFPTTPRITDPTIPLHRPDPLSSITRNSILDRIFFSSHPLQLWDVRIDRSSDLGDNRGTVRRIGANDDDDDPRHHSVGGRKEEGGGGIGPDDDIDDDVGGPYIEIAGIDISRNSIICPPAATATRIMSSGTTATITTTTRPSLGITLPYLYIALLVPLPDADFTFEVRILDDRRNMRRFRASTYRTTTVIRPDICVVPLRLETRRERSARDAMLLPPPARGGRNFDGGGDGPARGDARGRYGPGGDDDDDDDDENDRDHRADDGDDGASRRCCWNRLCVPLSEYTRRAYGTNYVETMSVQIHANCRLKRVYFAEREMNEDDELPEEFRLYYR